MVAFFAGVTIWISGIVMDDVYLFILGGLIVALNFGIHSMLKEYFQKAIETKAFSKYSSLNAMVPYTHRWRNLVEFFEDIIDSIHSIPQEGIKYLLEMEINKRLREKIFSSF